MIVMPKPLSQQISLSATWYYHTCSRTDRNAFIWGVDKETGVNIIRIRHKQFIFRQLIICLEQPPDYGHFS
jgi:hypothetical protein